MYRRILAIALATMLGGLAVGSAEAGVASKHAKSTLHLVAIGDSIPYGGTDCNNCRTFVDLYAARAARDLGVRVTAQNLSQHDNLTTARLKDELLHSSALRRAIASADVILVSIGFNDTPWNSLDDSCDANRGWPDGVIDADWTIYTGPCLQVEVQRYRDNLSAVFAELRALRKGKRTLIRQAAQYNDIVNTSDSSVPKQGFQPSVVVDQAYAKAACSVAKAHAARCADIGRAFNGPDGHRGAYPLLGPDATHPNAAGHKLIAKELAKLGYRPLRPSTAK
jgi:lysophospholipase L1-like esterase